MGSRLLKAAAEGDIDFVRDKYKAFKRNPSQYFLGRRRGQNRNLLHEAIEKDRYSFLFETLKILSSHPQLVIDLICQQETWKGCNSLHSAARQGNIFILKLLVNAYTKAVYAVGNNQETPPWLVKNFYRTTPVHSSFENKMTTQENIARYLVSQDEHLLRTLGQARYPMEQCSTLILDGQNRGIVYLGMEKGFSRLVEQILTSDLPYALSGPNGQTPLQFASKCNEQIARLLLGKHQELIGKVPFNRETVLHHAVEDGATWLVRLMLAQEKDTKCTVPYWSRVPWIKACRRLIWHINKKGDTPLHIAARKGNVEISKLLIQGYKSAIQDEAEDFHGADPLPEPRNDLVGINPLYIENLEKDIPLVVAFKIKHDDCGVILSEETFPFKANYEVTELYRKFVPLAVENGCLLSAKMILERVARYSVGHLESRLRGLGISSPIVLKIFRHVTKKDPVTKEMIKAVEFEKLLEVFPRFLEKNKKDVKTILKEAAEKGEDWLVRLALESDTNSYKESAPAWQVACEKGYYSTLQIFIELCNTEDFNALCNEKKQTPLHHIKFMQSEQYVKLLQMPVLEKLKNATDSDGATPLHRAILRDDLELTKVLLETKGIKVNIKDNNGTMALDLLEKSCALSTSWSEQYVKLLAMPELEELKNVTDSDGATPLHRAILRDDLELTRVLLETKGIEVNIEDNNGTTALDLLEKRCALSTNWGKMCREIKQDSTVKNFKYLFKKISFQGMQHPLSVVAALVATITFAAGFTVPGGPDSKNGTPVLATKAAFLAFSVFNTIAMCCSIMVLFLLLGPMMWDPNPSVKYVYLSLFLLFMSLGGTILAFMTGFYATMASKANGDAIFVIVSCSLALTVACIVLVLTYLVGFKKIVTKPFTCFHKVQSNAIMQDLQATVDTTGSISQQSAVNSNTPVTPDNIV